MDIVPEIPVCDDVEQARTEHSKDHTEQAQVDEGVGVEPILFREASGQPGCQREADQQEREVRRDRLSEDLRERREHSVGL